MYAEAAESETVAAKERADEAIAALKKMFQEEAAKERSDEEAAAWNKFYDDAEIWDAAANLILVGLFRLFLFRAPLFTFFFLPLVLFSPLLGCCCCARLLLCQPKTRRIEVRPSIDLHANTLGMLHPLGTAKNEACEVNLLFHLVRLGHRRREMWVRASRRRLWAAAGNARLPKEQRGGTRRRASRLPRYVFFSMDGGKTANFS